MATGDIAPPEGDENGGNWFTIGYYRQADARRALGRDGEIVRDEGGSVRFMIGVRWRDGLKQGQQGQGIELGNSMALVRTNEGGSGSPMQPASAAFRKPEPPKASNAVAAVDQGVAGVSPSKSQGGWIGSVGDMIFGW